MEKNLSINNLLNNIYGRALTHISKELKKIVQRKKMINYKKDEIFVYDDREFVKQEYLNNNKSFKKNNEITKAENIDNNKKDFDKKTNQNEEDIIISNDRFKEI